MIGKIFSVKQRFKGVMTINIDVPLEKYEELDLKKEVEIIQKMQ